MAGIAMMCIAISSCDDSTTILGDSLTNNVDKFESVSQSFRVNTRSLMTDSVLAVSTFRYLGNIKDPETGAYITCHYMTQFNILENERSAMFPSKDAIGKDDSGNPVADSCTIRIMINNFQGDSLAAMKLQLMELSKPVPNSSKYYTDFDVDAYLRTTTGGVNQSKTYSISDLTMSDSLRNVLRGGSYYKYITIPLKKDYTDKNGVTYKGYDATKNSGTGFGTYLLRQFYDHQEYYKNSNTFAHNVCPGFYIKSKDGLGSMIEVANTQIILYYHYTNSGKTVNNVYTFMSTQEVLQITHVTNDKASIKALEKIDTCTFLKTPSGIFTEVDLPIDSIKWYGKRNEKGELILDANGDSITHLNDTIMSARLTFQAMRNKSTLSSTLLKEPTTLLMIPRDNLYSFFETNSVPNNITSYLATYNSTQKTYTYSAISPLINYIFGIMRPHITNADGSINPDKVDAYKKSHPNWNKVVLVPVLVTYSATNSSSTLSSVTNAMTISSVRLVGGDKSTHGHPTINIIYNKNE